MRVGRFVATRAWQKFAFSNPPKGWVYERAVDLPFHLSNVRSQFLYHTKVPLLPMGCDLFHSYNSIVVTSSPWLIEVESQLPRYGTNPRQWQLNFAIDRLKATNCKVISFTCEGAQKANRKLLEDHGLHNKSRVIYRPTPYNLDGPKMSENPETWNILFVGNAFYRKGGYESLLALLSLPEEIAWKLTIVSNFEIDWAVYPSSDILRRTKDITADNRIQIFSHLGHDQILEMMRLADISLQPTHEDSWNNVIPESMGQGTPVVATLVRNTPEIINESNAVTIPLDNTEYKKKLGHPALVKQIREGILALISDCTYRNFIAGNGLNTVKQKLSIESRNSLLESAITS